MVIIVLCYLNLDKVFGEIGDASMIKVFVLFYFYLNQDLKEIANS